MEIRTRDFYVNTSSNEYKTQQSQRDEFRQLVDKPTGGKMTQEIREKYDVSIIFAMDDKAQRKLQKKREERELEERRKQKERLKDALEEYAKYRRELRHYYNELGYQRKLAISNGEPITSVNIKHPPVVSGLYDMIMMLGM